MLFFGLIILGSLGAWGTGCGQGERERPGLNPRLPHREKKKVPRKIKNGQMVWEEREKKKKKPKLGSAGEQRERAELGRALAMAFCTMRE
jgi:hypothetical protein